MVQGMLHVAAIMSCLQSSHEKWHLKYVPVGTCKNECDRILSLVYSAIIAC